MAKEPKMMFLEIFEIKGVAMTKIWHEAILVESQEEAEDILRSSPDLYSNDRLMCSLGTKRGDRKPFTFTSWCSFYAPGEEQ